MVTTSTQVWTGNSGKTYTYEVYPINGPFPSAPAPPATIYLPKRIHPPGFPSTSASLVT